jgi:C1A family cysteine protease
MALFPHSNEGFPKTASLYEAAIKRSDDPKKGTSFQDVTDELVKRYEQDLKILGCVPKHLQNDLESLKCSLRQGIPVIAGYQVNSEIDAFHDNRRECEAYGYMLPSFAKNPRSISAHCVLIIGFDDSVMSFIARNSWGHQWGVDGHFLIRYQDVQNTDFFTDLLIIEC